MTATPEEIQDTKTMIRRHLAEGYLNVVIGKTYKLADAAQAHIDVMSNAGSRGKLILHPFDEWLVLTTPKTFLYLTKKGELQSDGLL